MRSFQLFDRLLSSLELGTILLRDVCALNLKTLPPREIKALNEHQEFEKLLLIGSKALAHMKIEYWRLWNPQRTQAHYQWIHRWVLSIVSKIECE